MIENTVQNLMPTSGGTFTGPVAFGNNIVDNTQIIKQGDVVRLSLGNDVAAAEGSAHYQAASGGALRFYNRGTGFYSQFRFEGRALTSSRAVLIPDKQGTLQISSSSSRRIKENIRDMSEERAKKLLDIEIVNFDYIGTYGGGLKDQSGVIAEDAIKIIPEAVTIPKGYDETKPIDENDLLPEVDYRQYIPYLIKMVQIQQKEIEELKKR